MTTHIEINILLDKLIEGTITSDERWKLERHSLDDPFLAEALEGYYDNKVSEDEFKALVFYKKKGLIKYLNPLSIAASVILLVGIAIVMNLNNNSLSSEAGVSMNVEEVPEIKNDNLLQDITTFDTITNDQDEKASETSNTKDEELKSEPEVRVPPVSPKTKKRQTENKEISGKMRAAPRSNTDYHIDGVRLVDPLEKIEAKGLVMDEQGTAIHGARVQNLSDESIVKTDELGQFSMQGMKEGDIIITNFNGYQTDSSVISEDMSIKLRRAESMLSEEHKTLEEMMTDNQIISVYKERLDHVFSTQKLKCTLPQNKVGINIRIHTNQNNQISRLEFIDNISDDCKREIRDILDNASFNEVFSSERSLRFNYKLKF